MTAWWIEHQLGIVVFLAVLVVIAVGNYGTIRAWSRYRLARRCPRVSVLLPVRNEELNVEPAVRLLLGQEYPDFEVVVLDDESDDGTPAILQRLEGRDVRLRVIRGGPLPEGWLGKLWACHQLAQQGTGELLLFTDADTRHGPRTLQHAVNALEAEDADLLSAVPREETGSWAEMLAVPVVAWSIMSFLPLRFAYRWNRPAFTAASGQFMLLRREAYERLGGHAAVRASVVDDLSLVRRAARAGMRWRLCDAGEDITCRMYRSTREVVDGFSKNLFGAFGNHLLPFAFVWLWLGVVFLEPPIVLGLAVTGAVRSWLSIAAALAAVAAAVLLWGISFRKFRFPFRRALLYPVHVGFAIFIAARSVLLTWTGRTTWKGRKLG